MADILRTTRGEGVFQVRISLYEALLISALATDNRTDTKLRERNTYTHMLAIVPLEYNHDKKGITAYCRGNVQSKNAKGYDSHALTVGCC